MDANVLKIGELLVERGRMTPEQAREVHEAQRERPLPFGVLAERMFGVSVGSVEDAWVEQYHRATGTLSLTGVKPAPEAVALLHRRQAFQFRMVPIRFERDGELLIAADRDRLARAVTFAAHRLPGTTHFRVAAAGPLSELLAQSYPVRSRLAA